eukprot:TRINITY_DN9249_c0_g1_i11.p2 TRINITY_DN9249_c0_g1~~TRINITY_DN9249_c0_g1_i11.p2  ORF type:complete len:323 (-),score=66.48 TRINITY_DN9249_c0_g1_i11:698-1666(-)
MRLIEYVKEEATRFEELERKTRESIMAREKVAEKPSFPSCPPNIYTIIHKHNNKSVEDPTLKAKAKDLYETRDKLRLAAIDEDMTIWTQEMIDISVKVSNKINSTLAQLEKDSKLPPLSNFIPKEMCEGVEPVEIGRGVRKDDYVDFLIYDVSERKEAEELWKRLVSQIRRDSEEILETERRRKIAFREKELTLAEKVAQEKRPPIIARKEPPSKRQDQGKNKGKATSTDRNDSPSAKHLDQSKGKVTFYVRKEHDSTTKTDARPRGGKCKKCGETGHIESRCTATDLYCEHCDKKNHNTSACLSRPQGSTGNGKRARGAHQ